MTAKTIIDKALSYLYTYDNGTNEVIFNDRYYGEHVSGDRFPWCCAFVWCIFNECGASDLFYDGKKTAYCPAVHQWGREKGLIVPTSEGQYGDIVLFDWNGDGVADHIGLIISRNGNGTYETVEGNTSTYNYTNGGYVLQMTRYYSSIIAIIRPQYDSGKTEGVKADVKNGKFVIDVSQHQGTIDWNKVRTKWTARLSAAVTVMILHHRTISSTLVTFPNVNALKSRKVYTFTAMQQQKHRQNRSLLTFSA